ncbi:MAG TPA: hypothetical protein VD973_17460 [Symbiobacteriaceae bacterium]|jgi:hypothetical protein|nr:hypothetical protein [Symbiobacteriaceae bacterium]
MIYHQQTITPDGWVFSEQRLFHPRITVTEEHARMAGRLYWEFLRRYGRPVLSVHERPTGAIDISLLGLRLLSFDTPRVISLDENWAPPRVIPGDGGWALHCPINGGLAVDPRHAQAGCLQMGLAPDSVSLTVYGYYPNLLRLHTRIYEWTQSALHERVARGYLPLLAQRLLQEAEYRCSN